MDYILVGVLPVPADLFTLYQNLPPLDEAELTEAAIGDDMPEYRDHGGEA